MQSVPVEFLSDQEAAAFGRYGGSVSQADLERFFYLDDADRKLAAGQREDHNRLKFPAPATMETWITDQDGDPVFMVAAEPSDSLAGELRRLLPQLRQVVGAGRRVTVCFDRGGWSPALFTDITEAGFGLLTWRKGPAPDVPAAEFTKVTCTDDRGRRHEYEFADPAVELGISEGPRKGQTVTLRQVTRLVPAKAGATRQIHALTSRTDLPAGEVRWPMSSRWREENYFRYARTRFALDALDSYAAAPDDPDRMVPNPARKTAAARIRQAGAAAQAAETARDAALLQLRSPAPGQAGCLTNQMINALGAPAEAAWRELDEADKAAATIPGPHPPRRARPGHGPPGRRDQADHPRHPDGRIQRRDHPGPRPGRPLRPRQR